MVWWFGGLVVWWFGGRERRWQAIGYSRVSFFTFFFTCRIRIPLNLIARKVRQVRGN